MKKLEREILDRLSEDPDIEQSGTNAMTTVHGVLAGAYRGRRAKLDALLTHASTDGGSTALCRGVSDGNLCDAEEPGPPTCPRCISRLNAGKAIGRGSRVPRISSRDPNAMTAGEINRELDRLDEQNSKLGQQMIDQGRGYERPSEYLRKTDPLSTELKKNSDRRMILRIQIEQRYGPGAPRRLPRR
jgi:hypothetical protein